MAPKELAPENPILISGAGRAYNFSKRSNSFFFDAEVYADAEIQIPVTYYPIWTVLSDNHVINSYPTDPYGAVTIKLSQGSHIIQGRFEDTPVRQVANSITVVTFIVIFAGIVLKENKKRVFGLLL